MTPQTPTSFSIEAEDIIDTSFVVETTDAASGGAVASLFNGSTNGSPSSGTLSYTFGGADGTYDLVLHAFDENDGSAPLEVRVNGALVGSFIMDNSSSSAGIGDNLYAFTVAGLDLAAGDVIEITGARESSEWARIDKIDFIVSEGGIVSSNSSQAGFATVGEGLNEVENLTLGGGYTVENNARYANGAGVWNVDLGDPNGTITGEFSGASGAYDMTVAYYDESDGQSDYTLLVNGVAVDSWSGTGGVSNTGDRVERTMSIDLADGDVIEIQSSRNDLGEVSRIDSYTLTPAQGGDPDPDPQPPGEEIVVEAEDMVSTGYFLAQSSSASGGEFMSLFNTTVGNSSQTGTLSYDFSGGAGVYQLAIAVFDENDGESPVDIFINGELAATLVLNGDTGVAGVSSNNRLVYTIDNLDLEPNDLIEIVGARESSEWARIDTLTFIPTSPVTPPANTAPTGVLGDETLDVGQQVVIDLDAAFSDAEGDSLTYTVSGSGASIATLNGSTLTITPSAAGTFEITVTANDGELDSAPATFSVQAAEPVEPGAPIVLEAEDIIASGFVVEGTGLASENEVASLLNSGETTGTLAYTHTGATGNYRIDLTAFDENDGVSTINLLVNGAIVSTISLDGQTSSAAMSQSNLLTYAFEDIGLTAGDVVTIEGVQGGDEWVRLDKVMLTLTGAYNGGSNTAPTGSIADISATIGTAETIDLNTVFTDADGDALTYAISGPGASIATLNGSTLTIDASVAGAFDITVIANDGALDSAPVTFTVTASEAQPTGDPITVEAEAMNATGYFLADHSAASGGQFMSLFNSTVANSSQTGTLDFNFTGGAGEYQLAIAVFDENDGQSPIDIYVNGELVANIVLDGDTSSPGVNAGNLVVYAIDGLNLEPNDLIEVVGTRESAEWARIDKLTFTPTGDTGPIDNTAPVGAIANVDMEVGQPTTIDLASSFTDADGDSLTFSVSGSGSVIASLSGSVLTLDPSASGSYDITVTANDGVDDSSPVTFTVSATESVPAVEISLEAEDIISTGFVVENSGPASEGQVASLLNSSGSTGSLSYTFTGGSSAYDLTLTAFDEADGVSTINVLVNGAVVSTITLDGNFGSNGMSNGNLQSYSINGLNLATGDVVSVQGSQGGDEWVRIDTLTFTPVDGGGPVDPPPPTGAVVTTGLNEAELLDLANGYETETRSNFANGEGVINLGDVGQTGTASGTFSGADGSYEITVHYLDESDGQATWSLLVNGVAVGSWNGTGGGSGTGTAAQRSFTLNLNDGDVVTVEGTRNDSGEMARIDSIQIDASSSELTAEDVDFFVFAGQSNSERHFYRVTGDNSPGDVGAVVFEDTIFALTGFHTTAIEAATGGSGSNETADPVNYWWDLANDQPGPELLSAIATINATLVAGGDIDGIIWSQGEDDARAISSLSGDADEFVANLKLATTKVFEYFWSVYGQDVPIFIQEIGEFPEGPGFYSDGPVGALDLIRQAQLELVSELSNVYLGAETAGVAQFDNIHFSVSGYGEIAEDLANSAVSQITTGSVATSQSSSVAMAFSSSRDDAPDYDGFMLPAVAISDTQYQPTAPQTVEMAQAEEQQAVSVDGRVFDELEEIQNIEDANPSSDIEYYLL